MPLTIHIPEEEYWDYRKEEFGHRPEIVFKIEHSLAAIQKWEAWHKKPFLTTELDQELFLDYIRCMTITPNVPEEAYLRLRSRHYTDIQKYMDDPMTATTVKKDKKPGSRKIVTAEVIYHWMIEMDIPFECSFWHLNQLMMLITVRMEMTGGQKKMSKKDLYGRNTSLNAARKAKLGTRG